MSAYNAFRSGYNWSENEEDDEVPQYERSDNDSDAGDDESVASNAMPPEQEMRFRQRVGGSNFNPNDENVVVADNYVILGLKVNEFILVNGQCSVTIQRGAVLVNKQHYIHASEKPFELIVSSAEALPMISSTQVVDRSDIKDTVTPENGHLFSSDYKSVVKLQNNYTGLESIGSYYSPFKYMFHNSLPEDDLSELEKLFKAYSFEIVLRDGLTALDIGLQWGPGLNDLVGEVPEAEKASIMVIGNKNSGKSTIVKAITNEIIMKRHRQVSIIDLDPGQSQFSVPYCLSITSVGEPLFGLTFPMESSESFYYGYTSPQQLPIGYASLTKHLIRHFREHYEPRGHILLINTPGWVKGYGKEILIEITSMVNPEFLLVMGDTDLSDLQYQNLKTFPGIFQPSKYLPSQLRTFSLLTYFHRISKGFDFNKHILKTPPYKVSYQTDDDIMGVNLVSVLGFDADVHFNKEDIALMLDTSIMGIHVVDNETYHSLSFTRTTNLPNYINSSAIQDYEAKFLGLCMVHSINVEEQYFNLYIPHDVVVQVKSYLFNGYKLILIKGEGEIPSPELLSDDILHKKKKANIPYIVWGGQSKLGGVWKTRRNVMRRSQRK